MKILEIDIFLLPPGAARRADEATAKKRRGSTTLFCLKLSRRRISVPARCTTNAIALVRSQALWDTEENYYHARASRRSLTHQYLKAVDPYASEGRLA
jgi:hypothetical protein